MRTGGVLSRDVAAQLGNRECGYHRLLEDLISMSIRTKMIHRASVTRNIVATTDSTSGTDPFGGPINPFNIPTRELEPLHTALPCYVQVKMERRNVGADRLVSVAAYLMLVPLGSDLAQMDIVTRVVNLRGDSLFDFKLRVIDLIRRESHLEAMLEEYS